MSKDFLPPGYTPVGPPPTSIGGYAPGPNAPSVFKLPPGFTPIADLPPMPERSLGILADWAASQDDPGQGQARVDSARLLSQMTGLDPGYVMRNYETVMQDVLGGRQPPLTNFEAIKRHFTISAQNAHIGMLRARQVHGDTSRKLQEEIDAATAAMPRQDAQQRSLFTQAFKAAGEFAATTVATTGALIERLPLAPVAIASAGVKLFEQFAPEDERLMDKVGYARLYGWWTPPGIMADIEGGLILDDLLTSGVSMEIARPIARAGGAVNAAIESTQMLTLAGTGLVGRAAVGTLKKVLSNSILSGALRRFSDRLVRRTKITRFVTGYPAMVASETVQENIQESVSFWANQHGIELENKVNGTTITRKGVDEWMKVLRETTEKTVLGMGVLGLGPSIAATARARTDSGMAPEQKPVEPTPTEAEPLTPAQMGERRQALDDHAAALEARLAEGDASAVSALAGVYAAQEDAASLEGETPRPTTTAETEGIVDGELWRRRAQTAARAPAAAPPEAAPTPAMEPGQLRNLLRQNMPALSEPEVDGAALIVDIRAGVLGMTSEEWIGRYFAPGVFAPEDVSARTRQGRPTAVTIGEDGRALFSASQESTFRSFAHEIGHVFRRQLTPEQLQIATEWVGGEWTTAAEEQFAEGWEVYLRKGQAPTPALQGIFRRMAEWLGAVMDAVSGRWDLSYDITSVYGQLLSEGQAGDRGAQQLTLFETDALETPPPTADLRGEAGFVYHATNLGRARDVAAGSLETFTPSDLAEQEAWPDGGEEPRTYWSENAGTVRAFLALDEGQPVILRTRPTEEFEKEGTTGDIFTRAAVPARAIEILGRDGDWHLMSALASEEGRTLFEARPHEQSVREAIATGEYVPDEVMADYAGRAWADAEIEVREHYVGEARAYGEEAEFVEHHLEIDPVPRSVEYYETVYRKTLDDPIKYTKKSDEGNRLFLKTLTKEVLGSHLLALGLLESGELRVAEAQGTTAKPLEGVPPDIQRVARSVAKGRSLTDAQYERITGLVGEDPGPIRDLFIGLAEDPAEFEREQSAMEALDKEEATTRGLVAAWREMRSQQPGMDATIEEQVLRIAALDRLIEDAQFEETRLTVPAERAATGARTIALRKEQRDRIKAKQLLEKLVRRVMSRTPDGVPAESASTIGELRKNIVVAISPGEARILPKARELLSSARGGDAEFIQRLVDLRALVDMHPDELMALDRKLEGLRKTGRAQLAKTLAEAKNETQQDIAAVLETIGPTEQPPPNLGQAEWNAIKKTPKRLQLYWSTLHPPLIAAMLGDIGTLLLDRLPNAATDSAQGHINRRTKVFMDAQRRLGISNRDLHADWAPGFTMEDVTTVYIQMQNPDSAAALRGDAKGAGNNLSESFLANIEQNLPQKWKDLGQAMLDVFSETDTRRLAEAYGPGFKDVQRYFPMRRESIAFATPWEELVLDLGGRRRHRKNVSTSWWRPRVKMPAEAQRRIRTDGVSVLLQSIELQEHFIAYGALMRRINTVFDDPRVQGAITNKFGTYLNENIQRYRANITRPASMQATNMMQVHGNKWRSSLATMALSWNVSTNLIQLTGPPLGLRWTGGPGRMLAAMWQYKENPKAWVDFVDTNAPQIAAGDFDPAMVELRQMLHAPPPKNPVHRSLWKMLRTVGEPGMRSLGVLDRMTKRLVWKAAYDFDYSRNQTEASAVQYAGDAIKATQPFAGPLDKADIYNNEWMMFLLIFTKSLNKMWGMISYDMFTARGAKDRKFAQAAWTVLSMGITGLMIQLIREGPPETPGEWFLGLTSQIFDAIPVVGGTVTATLAWEWYADRGVNPFPVVYSAIKALQTVAKAFMGKASAGQTLQSAVRAGADIGQLTGGFPGVAAKRVFNSFVDTDALNPSGVGLRFEPERMTGLRWLYEENTE